MRSRPCAADPALSAAACVAAAPAALAGPRPQLRQLSAAAACLRRRLPPPTPPSSSPPSCSRCQADMAQPRSARYWGADGVSGELALRPLRLPYPLCHTYVNHKYKVIYITHPKR